MNKELEEKMKAAFVANHGKPVTEDSLLSVVIEQCAAVASEHYGDKWTRVEDGLPDIPTGKWESEPALTYIQPTDKTYKPYLYVSKLWLTGGGKLWTHNAITVNVTHWMPLPQPPQQ